ncbi:branched-chain amino acid transport system substrate-binding protein [Methanomicrobium sp. W14]|uniref:ABC transporter substrate-binding protein n=1 Tax=Methanomicrobium sp. W14 TaxID=2817839 RepID=UPI001AE2652B|nr:ABC transporter substrate-binding protein [Methanomicrobium sp. W14]MBP2133056.1 branched-chain amino acid transport system substrate-binding protein [Methanomicrobium sp. W14]
MRTKSVLFCLKNSAPTVLFLLIIMSGFLYLYLYNFGPPPESYPEGNNLTVGAIVPLSGSMKTYGTEVRQGIEMAVSDINKEGGIKGKNVTVEYFDNLGSSNLAIFGFKKFCEDGIPVVIGPVSSSAALAVAPVAEEEKTVMISPSATNPGLTKYPDYVFRTISSDAYQGKGIAKVLMTVHPEVKTAAVIYINTSYGKSLNSSFCTWFPKAGGQVIFCESYEEGGTDYYYLVDEISEANPDAVVVLGTLQDAETILKDASEKKLDVVWFGSEGLINDGLYEYAGEYVNGMYALMQSSQIQSGTFIKRYESLYNTTTIDWPVSYGYDTMQIIAEALRASDYNGKSISGSLKRIRHMGLCGPKVFDENGDIPPAYDIMRIEDGKWVRVKWNEVVFSDDDEDEEEILGNVLKSYSSENV